MRIKHFLMIGLLIAVSGCYNKELDEKYGINFNLVRKQNNIPLLPKSWTALTRFGKDVISWHPSYAVKGYARKKVLLNENGIINIEENVFYSGKKVKCGDPDVDFVSESISMQYYFDETGTKVKKLEIYTNSPDASNYKIELNEAKSLLKKWGVDFDKLLTSE